MKRRTRKKNNTHSQKEINYAARAKYVRKFTSLPFSNKTRFSPQQKAAVTRAWKKFNNYRNTTHIATKNKKTFRRLKAAGFVATDKGVFIDKPRDIDGKTLKGARVRVYKSGVVVQTVGQRKTTIIGIPKDDRLKFADDPCGYLNELSPRLRKKLNEPQIVAHLMYGAFPTTSPMESKNDICRSIFNYLHDENGDVRRERLFGKKSLTGLQIIEHDERVYNGKKRKKAKKRKARKTSRRS